MPISSLIERPAALLDTLLESSPTAMALLRPLYYAHDAAGSITDFAWVYLNPAAQCLLAQPPQPTASLRTLFPDPEAAGVFATCQQAFVTECAHHHELPAHPAGAKGAVQLTAQRHEHLVVVHFTAAATSAPTPTPPRGQVQQLDQALETRVQERTQQLHEQLQLIASVFEQAPAGVWVVQGPNYVFELYNPQMGRMLGPTPQQALGRPYFEVLPELVSQGIPELLRTVWENGETVVIEEYPAQLHRHTPGESGYFTFTFQPLRDSHGQVTRIGCVALDVTTQVVARQQVQQLNRQLVVANQDLHKSNTRLQHTNADLDTFVYTASHDLKAPITNLEGLLQALQEEVGAGSWTPAAGHVLLLMQDAVERFRTTLTHLTEVTHLQLDAELATPVEVAEVVAGVELDLAPLLAVAHAQLTVDVANCPTLYVATKTVRSVVYNLLSNALKYRAPERTPVVHVRCWCHNGEALLSVTDNGLGIDLARQTELFGLFRRYHTHVDGAGVGLYMVKRMVEHAGGRIAVQSQLGVGSTFTVAFPLPHDEAQE